MRNLLVPLAIAAVALMLAAMPVGVSANSNQQHCEAQWKTSAAADTCTQSLYIYWTAWEKCRIAVHCVTDAGGLQSNDFLAFPEYVPGLINCNGALRYSTCNID